MKNDNLIVVKAQTDLALNSVYIKGQNNTIRNCWHFYTNGNDVEVLFPDNDSFKFGMDLTARLANEYNILIFAFVLMDTHVHFILYGEFLQCQIFMHKYIKIYSMHLTYKYRFKKSLAKCRVEYQIIGNDLYLKTVIAYVLRNPYVAGVPYTIYDYPWGSGALYFRGYKTILEDWQELKNNPNDYVCVKLVEEIYHSHKSFFYFLGRNKEEDVELDSGSLSQIGIPISELRQHKKELCRKLFDCDNVKQLDLKQRSMLFHTLLSTYRCSKKIAARLAGITLQSNKL